MRVCVHWTVGKQGRACTCLQGVQLANKDADLGKFDKSDPYLKIFAMSKPRKALHVHSTEVCNNNLNPVWKPFQVDMNKRCATGNTHMFICV